MLYAEFLSKISACWMRYCICLLYTSILWGGVLYYVDYECNPYDAQWDFSHWGSRYWADTPELRAWLQEHGQN